jgi:hypothetical protein
LGVHVLEGLGLGLFEGLGLGLFEGLGLGLFEGLGLGMGLELGLGLGLGLGLHSSNQSLTIGISHLKIYMMRIIRTINKKTFNISEYIIY